VAARLDYGQVAFAGVLAMVAAGFGVVAGIDGRAAIAGAVALAILMLTIINLTAGLVAFVVLSFVELVPSVAGPTLSLAKVVGGVLALSWLAGVANNRYGRLFPSIHPLFTFSVTAFLAWNLISVIWAIDSGATYVSTVSFLLNFMLFPIVFSAVRTKVDLRYLILAFIAGAAFTAGYGVIAQPNATSFATSPAAASGLNRLAGTIGDPNELASLLAAGIALSAVIVFNRRENPVMRVAVAAAALAMLLGIFLTVSRGGLVALAAMILTATLIGGRHRPQALLGGLGIAAVLAILFFGVATPQARDRVTANDGGSGRTDIWQVGWRMVEDRPATGVGSGNFPHASIRYLVAPGVIRSDQYLVDQPSVAHNAYLQVLAETGVPGLAMFVGIIAACIVAAVRAQREFRRRQDRGGELMTIGVLMAIGALVAAYFFLSEQQSKHLWLLLSFCPALLAVSRSSPDPDATR
jgi:O-antigen ligase